MLITDKVNLATQAVKDAMERNEVAKKSSRTLAFALTLLPIPVIQQAATVLDRFFSEQDAKKNIDELWEEIAKINPLVATVQDMGIAVQEIAKAVKGNEELQNKIQELLNIEDTVSDFSAITEDNSKQEIINSIIDTDIAKFHAKNNSENRLINLNVKARKTTLLATNNSINRIAGSTFSGQKGSVGMDGISTEGNIDLVDSSVNFTGNSTLWFGNSAAISFTAPPPKVSLTCPCGNTMYFTKAELAKRSTIRCSKCHVEGFVPKI